MEIIMKADNDAKQTARTAALNTIANIITLLVGMAIIPVITRVISQEDLGLATTFISTRNILTIIFTLAVYAYVHKGMLEFKEEKKEYLNTLVAFCTVMTAFFFLIALPFREQIKNILSLDDFLFYWLFISCYILAVYYIGNYYCVFHNRYILVASMVLCLGAAAPVLSVVLASLLKEHKYIGRVLGLDSVYFIVTIIVLIWLLFSGKKKFRKKYLERTLRFTVPVIPHLLSQTVLTQCDLIMITYFCGSGKTGIFSMGHTVGYLALTVVTQIMAAWSPWVYRRFEEGNVKTVYQNSKLIVLLGTYISLGLLTISCELIRIFLTREYLPCIYIVPPLVVAMFFQFIYLFLYDVEYYHKKANWIAIASVTASVLNLILNWFFIQKVSYIAACYTTAFSYLVLLLMNYLFCKKLGVNRIYDIRYMCFWIVVVIVYAALMMILTPHVLVRYLLFAVITLALFCWKFRDLKELWYSLKQ